MVGYDALIAASEGISEEDVRAARWNSAVREKLDGNPLEYIIFSLVNLLETDSEESRQREKKKLKYTVSLPNTPESSEHSYAIAERPSTPEFGQPRFPSSVSMDLRDTKRKVSDSSFGTKSTENTPTKLVHPEAKVQSLQDIFLSTIIKKLWWGQIEGKGTSYGSHVCRVLPSPQSLF